MSIEDRSTGSPFNRSAQHDAKRSAILSQAAKLFNSKGSRATTLKDIAQSLGLTKTSLYYYVKTKEDLVYQCYMAALDHHHAKLDLIEQQHLDATGRATAFFNHHFDSWLAAQEGRGPHIAALLEIASLRGSHRSDIEERYIALFTRVRQNIRNGIEDGSFRPCHATSTTRAILGSLEWAFNWLHSIPRDQIPATIERTMDIIGRGLNSGKTNYLPGPLRLKEQDQQALYGFNREEQNRLKQEAFYKTGTWFFNKQGFDGTSLDEIAESLNVSKGAFYYHIKNKEDLLYNCYTRTMEISRHIYERASELDGNGLQKIDQSCRMIFHTQNSDSGPLIRYNTITSLPMERRKEVLKRTEHNNRFFSEFLRSGIEDGSIRNVDVFIAAQLIGGATNAAMDMKLWRRLDDLDSAAIEYFDIFFNGLLQRK
jgi:AcrR family transcriptional regulator